MRLVYKETAIKNSILKYRMMVFFAMRLLFADVSDIFKYIKELFIVLLTVLFPVFESYNNKNY